MVDPRIRIHRRQYIVGPEIFRVGSGWVYTPLDDGLFLSHCPDLLLETVADADGRVWHLLGLASQTSEDRADPPDELASLRGRTAKAIVGIYENWVGRWTLIGGGEIHPDATAQLPCHWAIDDAGRTWASSSPAVLRQRFPDRRQQHRDLVYERGLSWVAPPLGTFAGAKRLLPSQILDVRSGATRWRRLVVPRDELMPELPVRPDDNRAGADPAMARFLDAIGHGMLRLPSDRPKLLALTAGADSRLVLAAAVAAGVPVDVFTRRSARMSLADRQIPPLVAEAVGLDHREILPRRRAAGRARLAMAHTDGHVSPGDALPFVEAVRDDFVGIEIGGQGFGAGKMKNRHFPATIDDPAETAELIADHFGEPANSPNRHALGRWLRTVTEHEVSQRPEDRVDWRDRFYLEQRTAGWQAAKEQLYDLHGHLRFFPINSARIFGLLLAIDPALRRDGSHRHALIAMADDRLLRHPFNPPGADYPTITRVRHLLTVDPTGAAFRSVRKAINRR